MDELKNPHQRFVILRENAGSRLMEEGILRNGFATLRTTLSLFAVCPIMKQSMTKNPTLYAQNSL
jgi:hypothetical protein